MKYLTMILSLAMVVAGTSQSSAEIVRTEVSPINGHIYSLLAPSTWTDAESEAVSLGGHLATLRNSTEESWVWNTFSNNNVVRYLWIGLNDAVQDGVFVWSSGEPVTYTDWASGQPSGGDENYVQMGYTYPSGAPPCRWNDLYNVAVAWGGIPIQGVAEVPEPSTIALLGFGAIGMIGCVWRRKRV